MALVGGTISGAPSGTSQAAGTSHHGSSRLKEAVMAAESSFGRWLQRRRKALDLTQEELAQRVGCAAETIRKIEVSAAIEGVSSCNPIKEYRII